jgi:hypothetical protein
MAEIVWTHEAVQWLEEISGHGRHIALGFGADGLAIAQERGELHVAQHDWNEGLVGIRPGALQRHAPVSMEERFARRVGPDQKHHGIGLVDRVLDCFGPVFAWSKKPDRIDRLDAEARERFAQAPCGSCAVAAVGEVGLHWGAVSLGIIALWVGRCRWRVCASRSWIPDAAARLRNDGGGSGERGCVGRTFPLTPALSREGRGGSAASHAILSQERRVNSAASRRRDSATSWTRWRLGMCAPAACDGSAACRKTIKRLNLVLFIQGASR